MYLLNLVSFVVASNSKGFGFATFEHHQVASRVLKYLNNNPKIFSDVKRPIVDFAVEDKRALKHHEKLLDKLKAGAMKEEGQKEKEEKTRKRKSYSRGEDKHGRSFLKIVFEQK